MNFTHKDLCKIADKWLGKAKQQNIRFQRFPIHVTEIVCTEVNETPDAIGWNYCKSCVIEVKVSHADFVADQKKPFRSNGEGMGNYRYYLCPEGIIKEDELPCGWGLIYVNEKGKTREVKESEFWSLTASGHANEKYFLYSIARRLQNSKNNSQKESGGVQVMTSEQFIKIRNLIEKEFSHAVTKHPKFCDQFIDESARTWAEAEMRIKAKNSQPPEYADCVLMEEVAEAFSSYSKGDLEHALQEFAQCGAVVMRCMFYVMEKIDINAKT